MTDHSISGHSMPGYSVSGHSISGHSMSDHSISGRSMSGRRPGPSRALIRALAFGGALVTLGACDANFNLDLRPQGLGNAGVVRTTSAPRPAADSRGIISYPTYQVAVARRGDTVADVAKRIGLDAGALASFNGIDANVPLRKGEILALPQRVAEIAPAAGPTISSQPLQPPGQINITELAGNAIDRATPPPSSKPGKAARKSTALEPIRHKVERGETAYSISRLYNVSVRALAEWNGLGPDLSVRRGQYLLIPLAADGQPLSREAGAVAPLPSPPSAAKPLPKKDATPAPVATPPSPNLGAERTAASGQPRLAFPLKGKIIRAYVKNKTDGIDIAAPAGTPVRAAEAGVVAAITEDTDQVPILVIRHKGNLLTVYANVAGIVVKKGEEVKRGQKIAVVRAADPSFVHFEVRQGVNSVDPMPFLN